jgi:hypothetical protein
MLLERGLNAHVIRGRDLQSRAEQLTQVFRAGHSFRENPSPEQFVQDLGRRVPTAFEMPQQDRVQFREHLPIEYILATVCQSK